MYSKFTVNNSVISTADTAMDISAEQDRQIQSPSQLMNAAFDAVFASVPDEDQATYPDGWD